MASSAELIIALDNNRQPSLESGGSIKSKNTIPSIKMNGRQFSLMVNDEVEQVVKVAGKKRKVSK